MGERKRFHVNKSCVKRILRVPNQVVTTYQILLSIWEFALELHSSLLLNKDFASANIFFGTFLFLVVLAG
jgi:hypothetical protein